MKSDISEQGARNSILIVIVLNPHIIISCQPGYYPHAQMQDVRHLKKNYINYISKFIKNIKVM